MSKRIFAQRVVKRLVSEERDLTKSRLLVCPQGAITLLAVRKLRKNLPLEYVTWIMDDHLLRWRNGDWAYPTGFFSLMKQHLTEAKQVYVISPALQEFYKQKFGVDSTVLCGPAEARDQVVPRRNHGNSVRLAYFGSLGPWQNDAIAILEPLLSSGEVSLDVFSHNPVAIPSDLRAAGACLRDGIPASEVMARAAEYDALVLPISFTEERRNMSYFNIATKFSECLACGVPTLIIGPADAIMVKIARANGAAVIVDQQCSEAARRALAGIRGSARREETVRAALNLCSEEYSGEVMRSRWEVARLFLFGEAASSEA